jgi:hypothetical protein
MSRGSRESSVEAQYRTGCYRDGVQGKIGLAWRPRITQDAQFNRFNIYPEFICIGPYCMPLGLRTMMYKIRSGTRSN